MEKSMQRQKKVGRWVGGKRFSFAIMAGLGQFRLQRVFPSAPGIYKGMEGGKESARWRGRTCGLLSRYRLFLRSCAYQMMTIDASVWADLFSSVLVRKVHDRFMWRWILVEESRMFRKWNDDYEYWDLSYYSRLGRNYLAIFQDCNRNWKSLKDFTKNNNVTLSFMFQETRS